MDRISVAAGFSGHGFMLAPAIGETVAREIAGLAVDLPIEQFSLARFSGMTPAEAMSI
jgi:sarcosine oxidase subunit beta